MRWLGYLAYCIAGLALLISNSPVIFITIKYAGAIYLIYLGGKTFILGASIQNSQISARNRLSHRTAFISGFTSNILNPKTTLFFLSIFTQLVNNSTPLSLQLIYGVIICIAHIIWFTFLCMLLGQQRFLKRIQRYEPMINKTLGIVLVLFALKVLYL